MKQLQTLTQRHSIKLLQVVDLRPVGVQEILINPVMIVSVATVKLFPEL